MQGLRRMTRQASAGRPGAECSAQLFTERRSESATMARMQGMVQPPAHRDEKRSWIDGNHRRDGEC